MATFKNNYHKSWMLIQASLFIWRKIKNLTGHISAIKMNLLPKLNVLFQVLPIHIEERILKEWQRQINKFKWNDKKPTVSFRVLQVEKRREGLVILNLRLYYQEVCLVWIVD